MDSGEWIPGTYYLIIALLNTAGPYMPATHTLSALFALLSFLGGLGGQLHTARAADAGQVGPAAASSPCLAEAGAVNVPPPPSPTWRHFWRRVLIKHINNPIVLSFGDGTAFFVGVAAVALAIPLLLRFRRRLAVVLLIAVALIGVAVAISAATPLPMWAYAVWLVAVAGALVLCLWRPTPKAGILSAAALLAVSIGMCAAEIPHHFFPRLSVAPGETIYVLGDSLSAGVDEDRMGRPCPKLRCWPEVLGDTTQLAIVNLAKPGARVRHALAQAELAKQTDAVVIIEIGGNDFSADAAVFREQLETLVSFLRGHRAILMFELPLFPFQNAFGRAQREVAARHGVILIPKRCLTAVWCSDGGTLDGLHFSQAGHKLMARMIADVLKVDHSASPHKD
jgi:acyl-CoA thioesterase I